MAKLSEGIDPGGGAQTTAAMAAMAGHRGIVENLLQKTTYLVDLPLENSYAESLAFRGLAASCLGRESEAEQLFDRAIEAANAPIEASRTWKEHSDVARALVLSDRWQDAIKLTPMVGSEMARRTLELDLLVWWHLSRSGSKY